MRKRIGFNPLANQKRYGGHWFDIGLFVCLAVIGAKACMEYHPDRGGSTEMMQAVNQAYEVLKDYQGKIDLESGSINYGKELNEAINKIINLEGIHIEVCGAWIWVTGNTRPYAKILGRKDGGAGFYYASKKQAWYYRPAEWKSSGRGKYSLDHIRANYGSEAIKTRQAKKIQDKEAA